MLSPWRSRESRKLMRKIALQLGPPHILSVTQHDDKSEFSSCVNTDFSSCSTKQLSRSPKSLRSHSSLGDDCVVQRLRRNSRIAAREFTAQDPTAAHRRHDTFIGCALVVRGALPDPCVALRGSPWLSPWLSAALPGSRVAT